MRLFILPALLFALFGSFAHAASPAARPQFRGLWVTAWGQGLKSPAQVDRLVRTAKTAHLNALLVQVRKRGDAYYFSDTEPHAADVVKGFDPLAYLLEKAHAEKIQVHAWIVVYPAWSNRKAAPPADHVLARHPDWATYHQNGRRMTLNDGDEGIFLDPGLPEVQNYLVGVARELVTKYPVDGLHLDYIRYPGKQWGYHPVSIAQFREDTGHTPSGAPAKWDQWRRDQVTKLVARINNVVESERPKARLSAAVFPTPLESYTLRLQEWEKWARMGLVDFVAPMNYATTQSRFASRSASLLSRGGSRPVYMGVGGGNKPEAAVLQQMKLLQQKGVTGVILYHYDGNSPQFWQHLGNRLFQRPALVPDMPWKRG
ncbi:MAG: family 10 glycosylhydrolase [Armatimonadetes bacterium]|nr:family 10 glycosylhydrolase [Armatimonadota bacterium]